MSDIVIKCVKCNGRTHPMWPASMVHEEYLCNNCIDRTLLARPDEYAQMMRGRDAAARIRSAGQVCMNIYVASSWRNPLQPGIVSILRNLGHEVYDFRNPAPGNTGFAWSEIDPDWQNWIPAQWREALKHPIAERGYRFDIDAVRRCDACVYVLPCGKSASFELGYVMGMGKKGYVVALDKTEPELMFKEATIITSMPELFEVFGEPTIPRRSGHPLERRTRSVDDMQADEGCPPSDPLGDIT